MTSFSGDFGCFAGKIALDRKGPTFFEYKLAVGDVVFGALLCLRNKYNFILVECAR